MLNLEGKTCCAVRAPAKGWGGTPTRSRPQKMLAVRGDDHFSSAAISRRQAALGRAALLLSRGGVAPRNHRAPGRNQTIHALHVGR